MNRATTRATALPVTGRILAICTLLLVGVLGLVGPASATPSLGSSTLTVGTASAATEEPAPQDTNDTTNDSNDGTTNQGATTSTENRTGVPTIFWLLFGLVAVALIAGIVAMNSRNSRR